MRAVLACLFGLVCFALMLAGCQPITVPTTDAPTLAGEAATSTEIATTEEMTATEGITGTNTFTIAMLDDDDIECIPVNEGGSGETICITGTLRDTFCSIFRCDEPGPSLPPGGGGDPGGGGPGGGVPVPPKPTEEQCRQSFNQCRNTTLIQGRLACETKEFINAVVLVSQGATCFGDPSVIWQALEPLVVGGFPVYTCEEADWTRQTPEAARCRSEFTREASRQCMMGRHTQDVTTGRELTFQFEVRGFIQFGLGGSTSVTVQTNGGTGYRELCTAAALQAVRQGCQAAEDRCLAQAQEVAQLLRPPKLPSPEELLDLIDRERLGLDTGGPIGGDTGALQGDFLGIQQPGWEPDILYVMRLQFLADWSRFLETADVTFDQQQALQDAFQRAQTGFTGAGDDLVTLLIDAWLPDIETATPEGTIQRLKQFIESGEYEARVQLAEDTLFQDVAVILGKAGLDKFMAEVWPGIYDFGYSRPMRDDLAGAVN